MVRLRMSKVTLQGQRLHAQCCVGSAASASYELVERREVTCS